MILKALRDKLRSRRDQPKGASERSPETYEHADAQHSLGVALRNAGRTDEALAAFQRAIDLRADHAAALTQQGELLAELGRSEDAADSFTLALAFDSALVAAWVGYAKLMRACGRVAQAIEHLERAVTLAPASSEAWVELGLGLNQAGRTADAGAAYQKAIEAEPDRPAAYVNLGLLYLAQLGDAPRAETLFRRAIELAPDRVEAQANLGLALHEQKRSDEAIEHYDRLVDAHPHCAEYRWHRAGVRLALGDFERGWDDYEARKARVGRWRTPLPFPEWDGNALHGGALLIYAEQGIGDEIMFASCVPDALRAVEHCVVECDPRLAQLYRRSFPDAVVHGVDRRSDDSSWLAEHPALGAQCAVGSLPRYFRRSRTSFGNRAPYLVPEPERVERWRQRIVCEPGVINVGIAWRSGTLKTRRELRSTALGDWGPVLATAGARFFALQAASREELQSAKIRAGAEVQDLGAVDRDIDELAAAVSALDLVITVQGSVAHVAGAIGRPVWIVLNHSAEWRYLREGEHMPWYPTARLFRQPEPRAWNALFSNIANVLPEFVPERARGGV